MNKELERFSAEVFKKSALRHLNAKELQERLKNIQLRLDLLRMPAPKTSPRPPTTTQMTQIFKELEALKKLVKKTLT